MIICLTLIANNFAQLVIYVVTVPGESFWLCKMGVPDKGLETFQMWTIIYNVYNKKWQNALQKSF